LADGQNNLMIRIRLVQRDDLPAILAISNHYVIHSTCNFAVEPETLQSWQADWDATREMYPWFVAVDESIPPPSEGGGQEGGGDEEQTGESTHPLAPSGGSLEGRGNIIGFAKAAPYHGRCAYAYAVEITVYVHPDHHGRGIGKALYARLLSTLQAQGYHAVIAAIAQPNPISVNLHESLGLSHAGTFRGIGRKFGAWHDVGYWHATLQGDDHEPGAIRPVRDVIEDDSDND
jgi:phosphinothricin acetyltransferase